MDERLRALDRQRRGSGAITDEVAWLQERLRRELGPWALRLSQ